MSYVPDQKRKKTSWTGARFEREHSGLILTLIHNWSDCSVYLVIHFKLVLKVNHNVIVEVTLRKNHLRRDLKFLKIFEVMFSRNSNLKVLKFYFDNFCYYNFSQNELFSPLRKDILRGICLQDLLF